MPAAPTIAQIVDSGRASNSDPDTVTLPTTDAIVAGDLLGIIHGSDNGQTRLWPAGWQEYFDLTFDGAASVGIALKVATGGETTADVDKSGSERFQALSFKVKRAEWYGTLAGGVAFSSGVPSSGAGTAPNADAVSATWLATVPAPTLFLAICVIDTPSSGSAPTMSTWPTNYNDNRTTGQEVLSGARVFLASRAATITGAEDPSAFGLSSAEEHWAVAMAIRGAAPGIVPSASTHRPRFFPRRKAA